MEADATLTVFEQELNEYEAKREVNNNDVNNKLFLFIVFSYLITVLNGKTVLP